MSDLDGLFTEMLAALQEAQAEVERDLAPPPENVLPLRPIEARDRRVSMIRDHRDQARALYLLMIERGAGPVELTLAEELAGFFQFALDRTLAAPERASARVPEPPGA